MIRNIIILSFRYLIKYKSHNILNIIGLAIGFTAFILVSLYVNYEYSWDKHNVNYDRLYRVQRNYVKARHAMDGNDISPHTRGITAKLLFPRYPEIENILIIKELNGLHVSSDGVQPFYDNRKGYAAEQSIFQLFTYNFLGGDKNTALTDPFSVVLSETMAKMLFNDINVVGKTVILEKKFNLKVTGVYRDLPQNSIFRPSYIVSLATLEKNNEDVRNSYAGNYMTYVMLKPGQDYKGLNQKIGNLFKGVVRVEDEKITLCPMSKLYLSFNDQKAYLIVLSLYQLIGIFILLLAAFNYINFTTANSALRAKEIGIRKLSGSSRRLLFGQFLSESLFLTIISLNLALFSTELILPMFNNIVQKDLVFSYSANAQFILEVSGIALLTGFLSGIYPALFMSSQNLLSLFRGNVFKTSSDKVSLKKVLVTSQFSISVFLITLSLANAMQIRYMLTKDLGFDKENILYATLNITRKDANYEDIRNRILSHPEIVNCALSRHVPFASSGGGSVNWEGCIPGDVLEIRDNEVSYDFVKNFGIAMADGRDFSRDYASDAGTACLINETAWHCFGYSNPIGKRIDDGRLRIVGVMKDFHFKDMFNTIEPAIVKLVPIQFGTGNWTFSFRFRPGEFSKAERDIRSELEQYFPNDPFTLNILSDAFRSENVFKILDSINNSLVFFTILNVLLAAMGLLGLISFTTQRRTKEIGIRKIHGSSSVRIFVLLTREYLGLLVIASLISWPCGAWVMTLIPFNYKMSMPYWLFAFASVIIAAIALTTSFYHTFKASRVNSVKTLRYE